MIKDELGRYFEKVHIFPGTPGQRGGDGGIGGRGGPGGLGGKCVFIEKTNENTSHSPDGDKGSDGESGKPGRNSNKNGKDLICYPHHRVDCFYREIKNSVIYDSKRKKLDKNTEKIKQYKKKTDINISEKKKNYYNLVNETNFHFLKHLNNDFIKNSINKDYFNTELFYLIESVESVSKNEELKTNNLFLIDLKKKLNRFQTKNQFKLSKVEQYFLDHIQAIMSSFIIRYNSIHDKVFVNNLEKHLEFTISTIQNLNGNNENLTETYRINYKKNLEKNLKEVNNQIVILHSDIQMMKINPKNENLFKLLEVYTSMTFIGLKLNLIGYIKEGHNTENAIKNFLNDFKDSKFDALNISVLQNKKEIEKALTEIKNKLSSNSNDLFDFKNMQIKETLNELKNQIFYLADFLKDDKQITTIIYRLKKSVITLIDIHSHIESFVQQNEFTNEMKAIQNRNFTEKLSLENEKKLNFFKKLINENIIEERFYQAIKAFKYWSYPFDCNHKQTNVKGSEKYVEHLEYILKQVKTKENLFKIENYVNHKYFSKNEPFFQWTSKNSPYELKQLLIGKSTTLYADIDYARFDNLKFCNLEISFETDDSNSNKTLNELLNEFKIQLKHSGESYYKFNEKTFTKINMENLNNIFEYENASSKKKNSCENGYALSPFTFWTMSIEAIKKENEDELLEKIKSVIEKNDELKVFLYGYGQYTDETKMSICKNEEQ